MKNDKNLLPFKTPLIFSHWLDNRSCLSCTFLPLCQSLSYKEIAIIQLFHSKRKQFFTLNEFHEEFLKHYVYERDSYSTFYNIINNLTDNDGILLKICKKQFLGLHSFRKVRPKRNDIFYSLNPAYSLNFIESISLDIIESVCPIGMNPLCFQILEILTHNENGLTVNQLYKKLKKNKKYHLSREINLTNYVTHTQTIRRRLTEMNAINIILCEKSKNPRNPDKYFANPAHFLTNKNFLN